MDKPKKPGRKEIYEGGSVSKGFRLPKNKFDEAVKAVENALIPFRSDYVPRKSAKLLSEHVDDEIDKRIGVNISPELTNHFESIQKVDEAFDSMLRNRIAFPELKPNRLLDSMPIKYPCGCEYDPVGLVKFKRDKNCKLEKDKH